MKKGFRIGIVLILVMLLSGVVTILASNDILGIREHGIKTKEKLEEKDDKVIVKISKGKETIILKNTQLDSYVMNLEFVRKEKVDKDAALKELIRNKSLYLLACDAGYEVDDNEVKKKILEVRNLINSDDKQRAFLDNYLSGLGISEDDYFEQLFDKYKVNLTIGNYKNNKLKLELIQLEPKLSGNYTSEFTTKLDTYIDEMLDKQISDKHIIIEYND